MAFCMRSDEITPISIYSIEHSKFTHLNSAVFQNYVLFFIKEDLKTIFSFFFSSLDPNKLLLL